MDLQEIFYLVSIIFIVLLSTVAIYLLILINSIKQKVEILAIKTKHAAEDINIARHSLKAGILKMFLSMLGNKGGERYE